MQRSGGSRKAGKSKKLRNAGKSEKAGNPFRRAAVFLVDRLGIAKQGKGNRVLFRELDSLSMGKRSAAREYYIRKMELTLLFAVGGILAVSICFAWEAGIERSIRDRILARPGYGEGDKSEELDVKVGGKEVQALQITVQERKYTDKEKDELLAQSVEELEKILPGENDSLDEVRKPLVFPSDLQEGAVTAEWVTIPYGVVDDEDGSIIGTVPDEGVLVELQALLSCGGKESTYSSYAKVFPLDVQGEEKLRRSIQEEAGSADERDKYKGTVTLPDTVDGTEIVWEKPSENMAQSILALTILAVVCIYVGSDQVVHRKAENRRNQLAADYPDLMWKMAMLMEAGMTIKGAFSRITAQYQKDQGSRDRYICHEMAGACREMKSGISEAEAYERFGQRCQLPEYVRLGSYLSQNLKKGSRGLAEFLEKEAALSLEERRMRARKLGEQAGTKLLFPMMLMLGVVLVILMVPAFLSF